MANIGKSIVFKGELTGDEDIEIEGQIEGRIDLPSNQLTVGAHGRVKAEIAAKAVVIIGQVTGNVSASERLEIQASGVVEGDIRSPRLVIQEGAVVNGSVEMTGESTGRKDSAGASQSTAASTGTGATAPAARKTG